MPPRAPSATAGFRHTIPRRSCGLSQLEEVQIVLSSHVMTTQFKYTDRAAGEPARGRRAVGTRQAGPRGHLAEVRPRKELSWPCRLRDLGLANAAPKRQGSSMSIFLWCGLRGFPAAISGQFSSSSLCSSFVRGRRTTGFLQAGTAQRGVRVQPGLAGCGA